VEIFSGTSSAGLGVFALGLLLTGLVGGLLAGLLGVGGGIIVVPVLYHVMTVLGVDESVRMHVTIGTSLATIIPTTYSSVVAHSRKNAVDWALLKRWSIPMLVGVLAGSALAAWASGRALALVFGIVALPIAVHFAFNGESRRISDRLPGGAAGLALPVFIGGISTMMGIGGGAVGVPVMTLCGVPIHRAVGTASAFGALISVPGTAVAIMTGWQAHALPPWSLGYVNLPGFALIAPTSFFAAPFGAEIAHMVDRRRLRKIFALFIAIISASMLWGAPGT